MIKSLSLIVAAVAVTFGFTNVAKAEDPKQGSEIKNSLGMRLVYIPPGKFTMGSPESEQGRESQESQHENARRQQLASLFNSHRSTSASRA